MEQLQCAAEAFLEGDDGCSIELEKKLVKLSKIMDWYKVDFGANNAEVKCDSIDVLLCSDVL